MRVYFAPEILPIDAGTMAFGSAVNSMQRQPMEPGVEALTISNAYIPSECTSLWKEPLTVIGIQHHQHLIGTHVQQNVYRDGKNIGPMRVEHHFDFNHQSFEESLIRTLYPGDQIRLSCTFDTSARNAETEFGDYSQQEMCLSGVMYYPKQEKMQNLLRLPLLDMDACSRPGTGTFDDVSLCAQKLTEDAVGFLNLQAEFPFALSGATLCNLPIADDRINRWRRAICPPCRQNANCTDTEMKEHAQTVECVKTCDMYKLSVFPDTSRIETDVSESLLCHNKRMAFAAPADLPEPVCERRGDLGFDTLTSAATGALFPASLGLVLFVVVASMINA